MTGYLWLCEKCDGAGGYFWVWQERKGYIFVPGNFLFYTGPTAPIYKTCEECSGRGCWEP